MKKILVMTLLIMGLTACGASKKDLGLEKKLPDASQAVSADELVLPPNYNLRPVVPMSKADDIKR